MLRRKRATERGIALAAAREGQRERCFFEPGALRPPHAACDSCSREDGGLVAPDFNALRRFVAHAIRFGFGGVVRLNADGAQEMDDLDAATYGPMDTAFASAPNHVDTAAQLAVDGYSQPSAPEIDLVYPP